MSTPETLHGNESTVEAQNAAAERSKELLSKVERSGEQGSESSGERAESARKEAEAAFTRESGKERTSGGEPTASAIRRVTKKEREASYNATMKHVRSEMSLPARTFSKVIHQPVVEKSSEILGSSLARPNAILAGSVSALILVTLTYLIARTFGYQLSGFETIGAFVLGWLIGIIYDFVKIMAAGGQKK
jgi:hypothetical protein